MDDDDDDDDCCYRRSSKMVSLRFCAWCNHDGLLAVLGDVVLLQITKTKIWGDYTGQKQVHQWTTEAKNNRFISDSLMCEEAGRNFGGPIQAHLCVQNAKKVVTFGSINTKSSPTQPRLCHEKELTSLRYPLTH